MQAQPGHNNKCRTCFGQTKGLQPLGKLAVAETPRNISYAELLKEVADINVTDDKGAKMPQHICLCCSRKLKSSHAFIKQAQEVNAKLWSLLNLSTDDDGQKLQDCLEESEIDIQKCLEIKMESDQDGDNVKEEPVTLSEHYNLHPKKEINENISSDGEEAVKEDNNIATTNFHKYADVLQSSQTSVDSSESDMEDYKEPLLEDNNEEISSIDLQNDVTDDFPQESIKQDFLQTKPAYQKKKQQQQKEIHQEDADTDIAVPCLQCNKIFNNSKELSRHLRNTHVPEEQKCACPVCGAKFTRSCNMYKHMRTLHEPDSVKMLLPTKEKTHECEKCHRKYTKKKHLNYHIKIKHSKEAERNSGEPLLPETDDSTKKKIEVRPLCFICGGSFSNKAHLIVHMRRHTGEKPFKCDLCDRAFPRISDLTCHRRIHTGEKPYKCKICEKTFRVSTKLATHMRSHTDERPYKCTQCERSFKYSKDLNIHTRIHTGERPYCCTVCGSTFTQSNSLKAHRMKLGHMESCT